MGSYEIREAHKLISKSIASDAWRRWTSEKPTQPGWYWRSKHIATDPVEIVYGTDGELWIKHAGFSFTPLKHALGQWAGPIPEGAEV